MNKQLHICKTKSGNNGFFCVSHYTAAENQNRGLLQEQQVFSATNLPGK